MPAWTQEHEMLLVILAALSPVSLLVIAAIAPLLIVRMPVDYFNHRRRLKSENHPHPVLRLTVLLTKNILGSIFVFAGVIMLFIPGQGLLTLFIGIMLMDFPGKYHAERWLISNTPVLKPINWLRAKKGRPPLSLE